MNRCEPRRREGDGRWDYTRANDGRTWPIGYCGGLERARLAPAMVALLGVGFYGGTPDEDVAAVCDRWNAGHVEPFRDRYHDDGHATADEARRCYRDYELDAHLRFHPHDPSADTLHRCQAEDCLEYTSGLGRIAGGGPQWHLCGRHQTRAVVERLHAPHDSFGTY